MTNIVRLPRNGTAKALFAAALDEADDVEIGMLVFLRKDGSICTDWCDIPKRLTALGLIDTLHTAFVDAIKAE